jgi:hypothetical protein
MSKPRNWNGTESERFFRKVRKTSRGCWHWEGGKSNGYGLFSRHFKDMIGAHRWSYEYHCGPIPDGLTIDHLCRNKLCVKPAHLEAVTLQENIRRASAHRGAEKLAAQRADFRARRLAERLAGAR